MSTVPVGELGSPEARATIGDRLRRVRQQQGLSIRQLAQLAGISKTSVVQVESGRTSRRSTYLKVAEVLGMHLDHLAHAKSLSGVPFVVHRANDDSWFDLADFGEGRLPPEAQGEGQEERKRLAVETGVVPLNILACRLERGRIKPTIMELYRPSGPRSHAGEEHVFVLAGTALVTIGTAEVELATGESVTFWSGEPHKYAPSPGSPLPVRILSVRVDT
jgi:transcriptional regulator with XRE-family HTH domain